MALDASKVRVAITGAVSKGLTSAAAPTGTASTLTGFVDGGYIGEDGVTLTLPDGGDRTTLRAWQNGAPVRVLRTPSEDNPTLGFVFLETNLTTIETYFGVTITQTATEGSFEFDVQDVRGHNSYVLDVVDGAELIRNYAPNAIVTSVGDLVYNGTEPIGYEITLECERDNTKGYNFKQWSTALKTP